MTWRKPLIINILVMLYKLAIYFNYHFTIDNHFITSVKGLWYLDKRSQNVWQCVKQKYPCCKCGLLYKFFLYLQKRKERWCSSSNKNQYLQSSLFLVCSLIHVGLQDTLRCMMINECRSCWKLEHAE